MSPDRTALRIAAIYVLVAGLWIALSDRFLMVLGLTATAMAAAQTWKGLAFVVVTGALLYGLISRGISDRVRPMARQIHEYGPLADALESVTLGVALYDAHDRLVMCNRLFRKSCATARELIEENPTFGELVHKLAARDFFQDGGAPDNREQVQTRIDQFKAGDTWEFLTEDDEWYVAHCYPTGSGYFVLVQRTTERHRLTERARRSEQRYRQIVEHAPMAMVVWDLEGRITSWNRGARELFGWTRDEVEGHHYGFLVPESERQALMARVNEMLATRSGIEHINRNLTREGQVLTCRWRNVIQVDLQGNPTGGISIAQDITAKVEAERSLQASEARYRELAANLPGIVHVSDDTERFGEIFVNDALAKLTAFTPDDCLHGRVGFDEFYHPDDLSQVTASLERSRRERQPYQFEARIRDRDEGWRWVMECGTHRFDSDGRVQYRQGFLLDISERKQAESELRQSEQRLRRLADELATIEARERRALAEFLHDNLSQRLALAIMNLKEASRSLDRDDASAARDSINLARKSLTDCSDEIQQEVRNLTPMLVTELGLSSALEATATRIAGKAGLTYRYEQPGRMSEPDYDLAAFIHRAGEELLTNVGKHARASRVEVLLRERDEHIELSVADDGKGFAGDVEGIADDTKRFGLYGLRERADLLGGNLTIKSEAGNGSTITLRIPVRPAEHGNSGPGMER